MGALCVNYLYASENECKNDTTKKFDCRSYRNWHPACNCLISDNIARYREVMSIRTTKDIEEEKVIA